MKTLEGLNQLAKDIQFNEESAFEKLLTILIDFGIDESYAEQLIADCIDEQYRLDAIADKFNDIYENAKEVIINQGNSYQA